MFNLSSLIENIKSIAIKLVLLGGTTLIGLVWLSIGLNQFLTALVGSIWAPFIMAGLFILPVIIYAVAQTFAPKKPEKAQAFAQGAGADSSVTAISRMIEAMSGVSPVASAAVAVAAGFMVTRFPSLLNVFAQLVTAFAEDLKVRKAKKAADEAAKEAARERAATPPPPPDIE